MFHKYIIPQNAMYLPESKMISLSFTEISNEPSLTHSHPYFEILIPQNNFGVLTCNTQNITLQKYNFYIIPSNITHAEINKSPINKAKYFAIKIQDKFQKGTEYPLVIHAEKPFEELSAFLKNALKALRAGDEKYALLNLECFYHGFQKLLIDQNVEINTVQSPILSYSILTKEIQNYLLSNCHKDIKIKDVAERYNLSHCTLIKKFKADLGISPRDFLVQARIQKAKDLLLTSDFTITQIASFCGFLSPAYFVQTFRENEKITPKEYRVLYLKK